MSMKIEEGKAHLLREVTGNPANYLPVILSNYEDFISLTFNENPKEYKARKPLFQKRLKLLEQSNQKSPYYLFGKALLYFQWSIIQIKYADYWDAAWDFRKSFITFKENKTLFPAFAFNDIYIGAQEAVISTIPSGYKWISKILGMKGNMKNGMNLLGKFINSDQTLFKEESFLYYIYLKNYLENEVEAAAQIIKTYKLDTKNNLLFAFMAANLALNNKNAAVAESILAGRNMSKEYLQFPMLDYEMGDAKMKRLDYSAINYFEKFIKYSQSNFYTKDACYNIAICYYLMGKNDLAEQYKRKTKLIGKTESDADKNAHKNAGKPFPHRDLLKAKLLNDGGNNEQALLILNSAKEINAENQLEYYYRLGRVYDELHDYEKAISNYVKTIELGNSSTEYFAARAALQAGYIYEKKGNKSEALRYFNMTLNMEDHDYKNSLDQRAKSGINRIKGQ
ncbi:MAG: hypothetical protein IPJ31_12575 [Bacteroidetes bacterium]|nr:hypothetical protein [Bacteroidota bacterium]MBP6314537.1 hypothetical protein [Chitinophagaceae bacterium]